MKQTAVVDSNILVAIVDQQDKWHIRAKQVVESIIKKDIDLIYFDVIINETISVMARRSEEQKRSDQFTVLLYDLMQRVPEEMITWISWKMQQWYPQIITLVQNGGGRINFHDALIALACEKLDIELIISFDSDFDEFSWIKRYSESQ